MSCVFVFVIDESYQIKGELTTQREEWEDPSWLPLYNLQNSRRVGKTFSVDLGILRKSWRAQKIGLSKSETKDVDPATLSNGCVLLLD